MLCQGEPYGSIELVRENQHQDFPVTNEAPSANWRPGQAKVRTRKSVDHTLRHGAASMLRSAARRDDFDVPDLGTLASIQETLDAAMQTAVDNLRSQGHSWATIGAELGITRQSAHERFGKTKKESN